MTIIENLKWRYATKKFDPSKKVSEADLKTLKQAIQLSASSYGLQPYRVLVIEERVLREKLKAVSWGQSQIVDASQLIVFCNYLSVEDYHIDDYIRLKASADSQPLESLKGYANFMKEKIQEKTEAEISGWSTNQAYLALGNLLTACAALQIDACPMEGFEADKYNEILGLNGKGLNACVVAAIGYRSALDDTQYSQKVRQPIDNLFSI